MAKKKTSDFIPTTKKINPFIVAPFTEGSTPQGFMFDWINSDEYKSRLENNQYSNPITIQNNRLASVQNLESNNLNDYPTKAYGSPNVASKSFVNINPNDAKTFGYDTVLSHELGHVAGAIPQSINPNIGFNSFEEELLRKSTINPSKNSHDRDPSELKSDLDSNRYNLFKNNIYDIKQGQPFTQEHLNKAKESLKEDNSFNRLIQQTGDENYIQLMNTIASNKKAPQLQAKYGGKLHKQYNPFLDEYFLGGLMGSGTSGVAGMIGGMTSSLIPTTKKDGTTSIGGSTASGALSGFSAGAALGPIGMIGGAVLGGLSGLISGKKKQNAELEQAALEQQMQQDEAMKGALATMNYGIGNGSNLPMAMGGYINPVADIPIGSYNYFPVGGTHESNPYGGIPQGVNSQGQQMNTEEKEGKFKFKDGDYIFSNRLIFE